MLSQMALPIRGVVQPIVAYKPDHARKGGELFVPRKLLEIEGVVD